VIRRVSKSRDLMWMNLNEMELHEEYEVAKLEL
jgi:hypothetical protein